MLFLPKRPQRHRCLALTAENCQCTRHTRWFGRYCFQHTPKKLPILLAFLSSVLPFGAQQLYKAWIPSAESRQIRDARAEITAHLDSNDETAANIENLNLVLAFDGPINAKDASTANFSIVLRRARGSQERILEVFGKTMWSQNSIGEPTWGFFFSSLAIEADYEVKRGRTGYGMGTLATNLTELPIPLSVQTSTILPFTTIRDLRDTALQIFLDSVLAERVRRVEVVTNCSRHFKRRFVIFSKTVSPADWVAVRRNPEAHFGSKAEAREMKTLNSAHEDMLLHVESAKWVQSEVMPEMLRRPYN